MSSDKETDPREKPEADVEGHKYVTEEPGEEDAEKTKTKTKTKTQSSDDFGDDFENKTKY